MNLKILAVAGIATALASSSSAQTLTREVVASGFSVPIAAKSPPGDYERIFVAQRDGRVRIIKNGTLLGTDFKDIPGIQSGGEQGLLGIAFHPEYQTNGYFYASFTNTNGDSCIDRWTADPVNPDRTMNNSRVTVFGPISQPFTNHNGGDIEFGPDGYLYWAIGDGGSGDDPVVQLAEGQHVSR